MTTKTDFRIAVIIEGKKRNLISVSRTKAGGLMLRLWSTASSLLPNNEGEPTRISEERYHVHPSPNMEHKNAIGVTKKVGGNKVFVAHHHTCAIKRDNAFAPVYFRTCTDLRNVRYEDQKKKNIRLLGEYDPTHFTLMYGLFVGPKTAFFDESIFSTGALRADVSCTGEYQIAVVYTYFSVPSSIRGETFHVTTDLLPAYPTHQQLLAYNLRETGYTAEQCSLESSNRFLAFAGNHIQWCRANIGTSVDDWVRDFPPRFFRNGVRDDPEVQSYHLKCALKGLSF